MRLSTSEFEELRRPDELRAFVNEVRSRAHGDGEEFRRGLRRAGLYREFLQELVPLSLFAHLAYPDDHRVRLVLGNQGYDALAYDARGHETDRIELTMPQDGRGRASSLQPTVTRSFDEVRVRRPGDDPRTLLPLVLTTCRSKARKDYGQCTLVIAIQPLPPSPGFESDHEDLIAELLGRMREISFLAKRVTARHA